MASFLFDWFVKTLMGATSPSAFFPDLDDGTFGIYLVDEAMDTVDQALDRTVADRFNGSRHPGQLDAVPDLTGQTVTIDSNEGKFDANDTTIVGENTVSCESLELIHHVSLVDPSDCLLIANFDDYTGLPITPSGGNITVIWDPSGIIRI